MSCTREAETPAISEIQCESFEKNLPFPSNAQVHAVGVYEGITDHSYNYHPQGTVKVDVKIIDSPYILVLTAYEPIKWELTYNSSQEIRNNLAGIELSGYHCQEIVNIPDDIPIVNNSYVGGSQKYFYSYKSYGENYDNLIDNVESYTESPITTFNGRCTGNTFVIE